ncbi:hypothetical protein E4U54_003673 [Claviceps lovelessii]|nr:hypothetical protein E4U54_003673 [Claviceps lovelessii]
MCVGNKKKSNKGKQYSADLLKQQAAAATSTTTVYPVPSSTDSSEAHTQSKIHNRVCSLGGGASDRDLHAQIDLDAWVVVDGWRRQGKAIKAGRCQAEQPRQPRQVPGKAAEARVTLRNVKAWFKLQAGSGFVGQARPSAVLVPVKRGWLAKCVRIAQVAACAADPPARP